MTQTAAVLRLLRARGEDGLTPREARDQLACDRLAARVHELKEQGHNVLTFRERSASGAVYARYVLRDRPTFAPVHGVQEVLL